MSQPKGTQPVTASAQIQAALLVRCADTVDWLNGLRQELPGYMGPPEPETIPLIPTLITANRAGLLTTQSQPGTAHQRAFLTLICAPATADIVCHAATRHGVMVDRVPLGEQPANHGQLLVTEPGTWVMMPAGTQHQLPDGRVLTVEAASDWSKGYTRDEEIFLGYASPIGCCELVTLVDPTWGPSPSVWNAITDAAQAL